MNVKNILPCILLILLTTSLNAQTIVCPSCPNLESNLNWNPINEYTPTSAADLSNPNNTGKTALLSATFNINNVVLAPNQILVPRGGKLTGTFVNLNGATIAVNNNRAFATTTRFNTLYPDCLSPEMFGANTANDDANAIEAMVVNAAKGINLGTNYNFNTKKTFSTTNNSRTFQWIGNNATISTVLQLNNNLEFVLNTTRFRMEICNLVFDGNHLARRFWKVDRTDFSLDGVEIKNFLGEGVLSNNGTGLRGLGIYVLVDSRVSKDIKVYNSKIHHIGVVDDGNKPAASTSISRCIWFTYINTEEAANLHFKNSEFSHTSGVDADAIHFFESNDNNFTHDVHALFEGCTFVNNQRRSIKAHMSNVRIRNCTFIKHDPATLNLKWYADQVAQGNPNAYPKNQATTEIGFGTTGDGITDNMWVVNCEVTNSTFTAPFGSSSSFVYLTNNRGNIVSGNSFSFSGISTSNAVGISKLQDNNLIENNSFVNCGISIGQLGDQGYTTVQNNTFDYLINSNTQDAVIRSSLYAGIYRNFIFDGNVITLDFQQSASNFYGLYGAHLAGQQHTNVSMTNNHIIYSGPQRANQELMRIQSNFGASNTFSDNTVCGIASINGAITLNGGGGFVNTNNVIDCTPPDPPASADIWLEAECANIGAAWTIVADTAAAGGQYLMPPTIGGTSNTQPAPNITTFSFEADAGTYKFYARLLVPNGTNDSYWVSANGGNWIRWNELVGTSGNFEWRRLHQGENPNNTIDLLLTDGTNTIEIAHREDGMALDKIHLTSAADLPIDFGGADSDCLPDDLWLEAECATIGANWSTVCDTTVSGAQYLMTPTVGGTSNTQDPLNTISFSFVAAAGTYSFYARLLVPNGTNDSYWVRANDGAWIRWNELIGTNGNFEWRRLHTNENPNNTIDLPLNEGVNTIDIAHREDGMAIDKIHLTQTTNVPANLGGNAPSCTTSACKLELSFRLFLEGPYNQTTGLMRDDLRTKSILPVANPWMLSPDIPAAVLGVSGPNAVVDWVKIELRSADDLSNILYTASGLVQRDGDLVAFDGVSPVTMEDNLPGAAYVAVFHKSHLPAMTPIPVIPLGGLLTYDLSTQDSYSGNGAGQKELSPGVWGLYTGNGSEDKDINGQDNQQWSLYNGLFNTYSPHDFNLDADVNSLDKILWLGNNGLFTRIP